MVGAAIVFQDEIKNSVYIGRIFIMAPEIRTTTDNLMVNMV